MGKAITQPLTRQLLSVAAVVALIVPQYSVAAAPSAANITGPRTLPSFHRGAEALAVDARGTMIGGFADANTWTSIGPDGGSVQALAIDPTNPMILYASTPGVGIFKSTDGGGHWSIASTDGSVTSVTVLTVDPITPTTLYAGTNAGVVKSIDGGRSWNAAAATIVAPVRALAIDPVTPTTLYAGTWYWGVFKSTDGGGTWTAVNTGLLNQTIVALVIDPVTPTTLYAGTPSGLFKSTDGADSWSGNSLTSPIAALAIDPRSPTTLYASAQAYCIDINESEWCFYGIFKSIDGGASWRVPSLTGSAVVYDLAIDPLSSTTLYAGGDGGVHKSTDGGSSWITANAGLTITSGSALVIDPVTPTSLYAGTASRPYGGGLASGVFKTTDGGGSWSAVNAGLAATYVQTLAIDPLTPTTLYAGTDTGVFQSTDSGNSWDSINTGLTANNVQALAIDPVSPSTVYAGTYSRGLFKTNNAGASWSRVSNGPGGESVRTLTIDPLIPTTVYASTDVGVFKSTDGGNSWSNSWIYTTSITTLAIDPLRPTTLYVGTYGYGGGVFKTTDGGSTWSPANTGLTTTNIATLAIDPVTPSTLYAGTGNGGVFKTTNGGGSWSPINTGLTTTQITTLAINPLTPTTVYAGTAGGGVFRSADAGGSWSAFSAGLTVLNVRTLAIDPLTPTTLYGGTAGGGVFVATVEDVVVNVPPTASFTVVCNGPTCSFDGSGSSDPDGTITGYAWNFGDGMAGVGSTVSHSYAAGDTYAVTLTVMDNAGATSTRSEDVTVHAFMHVGDLDRAISNQGSTWTALVRITIHNRSHGLVANAAVTGFWNDGMSATCTTNAAGECGVIKSGITRKTTSVGLSVANVTHATFVYKPGDNHDPDRDSSGSAITVTRR